MEAYDTSFMDLLSSWIFILVDQVLVVSASGFSSHLAVAMYGVSGTYLVDVLLHELGTFIRYPSVNEPRSSAQTRTAQIE